MVTEAKGSKAKKASGKEAKAIKKTAKRATAKEPKTKQGMAKCRMITPLGTLVCGHPPHLHVDPARVARELNDTLRAIAAGPLRRFLGPDATTDIALNQVANVVALPPDPEAIAAKRSMLLYSIWAFYDVREFFLTRDATFTERLMGVLPLAMPPFIATQSQNAMQLVRLVVGLMIWYPEIKAAVSVRAMEGPSAG